LIYPNSSSCNTWERLFSGLITHLKAGAKKSITMLNHLFNLLSESYSRNNKSKPRASRRIAGAGIRGHHKGKKKAMRELTLNEPAPEQREFVSNHCSSSTKNGTCYIQKVIEMHYIHQLQHVKLMKNQ